MAIFRQEKPKGLNPSKPGKGREGLTRVEVHLDKEDFTLLKELVIRSGLVKRTRFLRWLLWVWKEVQDMEDGVGEYEKYPILKDDDPEKPVQFGLVKGGKFRGVKATGLPEGWRKG